MAAVLTTERLAARPWTLDDADAAYEVYRHDEVTRWLGRVPTPVRSPAEMRERLTGWVQRAETTPDPYGFWALTRRDDDALVGAVLLMPLPEDDPRDAPAAVEIGWHLGPAHWGHGYATEAGRGAAERGFAAGLGEVWAVVRPGNDASVAVCRRLGMEHVGRTERWYGTALEAFRLRR